MKKHYYDEPTQDEDLSWEDDFADSAAVDLDKVDEDAFSYADEDHTDEDDVPEEPVEKGKGKRKKSPERLSREAEFLALYEEYMHPTKQYSAYRIQCQLDDLYLLLYKLNKGWAYSKAKSYKLAGFGDADGDDALSTGCAPVYDMLKEDRATGNYCPYPIGHYLRIAQNKAIDDYFRKQFGRLPSKKKPVDAAPGEDLPIIDETPRRRKVPIIVGIDDPISDDNSRTRGEGTVEISVDPFANPQRPRWERDEKATRLKLMFLRELMDYPNDPPKPLALMYGNILFQLYKDYGGNDDLSRMAKNSTKVSSPEWAHQRMGRATLLQLGVYAERIVQRCFSKSLTWGTAFNQHMLERTADGTRRVWADIVYTKNYTEDNTSNWIESIMKSTQKKCSRKMKDSPDLREYAIETLGAKNKFRKALEKMEKEDCR